MTPMRLEPTAPRSRVKHSSTEPLLSGRQHHRMVLSAVFNIIGLHFSRHTFSKCAMLQKHGNFTKMGVYILYILCCGNG